MTTAVEEKQTTPEAGQEMISIKESDSIILLEKLSCRSFKMKIAVDGDTPFIFIFCVSDAGSPIFFGNCIGLIVCE